MVIRLGLKALILLSLGFGAAMAQSPATDEKITDVMVILTVKPGITRQQVMGVMHGEVRDTVRLYLNGKIRQWYSRSDGKGVVFILACNTVDEARSVMETLPLAKEKLMDYEYLALGPLKPLALLVNAGPREQ